MHQKYHLFSDNLLVSIQHPFLCFAMQSVVYSQPMDCCGSIDEKYLRMAADSTIFLMVNRLMALSLGVHLEQLEQRTGLTWPRPFLFRPLLARFFGISTDLRVEGWVGVSLGSPMMLEGCWNFDIVRAPLGAEVFRSA